MSKIKKLLALVLALTMVLSVSAFAGYTVAPYADADQVDADCEVAVQLLYSLDIMKGDDKGNFRPTATITRAEMAKMIYVILNYGEDDKAVNYVGAKFFTDVEAGAWYEGYVNYCTSTKLIAGRGDGTFDPTAPVTTAEAAKMLLTAIGYSAEARGYVGANWDKQVLSDASIIGLLDDYKSNVNTYAPRQWVAVMVMNALTKAYTYDTIAPVIFNGLLTGTNLPSTSYQTMGWKYFGLYEWEGIITANEYADLYATSALGAGKTYIDKGDEYFNNWTTTLDEIGEYRWGYAIAGDRDIEDADAEKVVYVGGDEENTTFSTGDETNLSTTSKFKSATGIKKGGEYFVNFADVATAFDGSGNGDWLKVIDNDGDGTAEYVFKTTFTMAAFDEVDSDDNAWLTDGTKFADDAYDLYEDAAYGDIVLYTTIDGYTYIELAPSFAGEAEKYTYKNDALTVDGEDYVESDIAFDETLAYFSEVELAKKDTEYTYYQDFFGHIRLFGEDVADAGDLVLLTDAYYETNRSGSIAAVDAYLDGEIKDTDVRNSATYTDIEMFINTRSADNNAWGRLVAFKGDSNVAAKTNIARYTMSDEGVMSLYDAETWRYNTKGEKTDVKTQYIDLIETDAEAGQTAYYGAEADLSTADGTITYGKDVKVQVNRNTVFYYVSYTGGLKIKAVTGYKNSYDVVDEVVGVRAMYAVATDVSDDAADEDYWVADAIVIETNLPVFNLLKNDIVLGYDIVNRSVSDYAYMDSIKADASLIGLNVVSHNGDDFDEFDEKGTLEVLNFFYNTFDEEGDSYLVDLTDYAYNDIYVGTVDRANKLYEYVTLVDGTIDELVYTDATVVYDITENARYNSIKEVSAGLVTGKDYIFFAPDGEIVYAILVADSFNADGTLKTRDIAHDLFDAIAAENVVVPEIDPIEKALKKAAEVLAGTNVADMKSAIADLETLDERFEDMTAAELIKANELIAELTKKAAELEKAAAETEAVAKAQAAYDALIDETVKANAETDKAWPVGADADAKEAVAKALADMTAEEIAALKPSKTDAIWKDVIVKVVEEAQAKAEAEKTTAGYKAIADAKAAEYMTAAKAEMVDDPIAYGTEKTVAAWVETAIKGRVGTLNGYNMDEFTLTVVAPADATIGAGQTSVQVQVTVTNSYAGVVSDAITETITVLFTR